MEKNKVVEIQDIFYKIKKIMKKNNEESFENSNQELKNSSLFDIYQDIKHIINKQNNIFKIRDLDNYIEELKDKILKIDFGEDKLIKNVKSFLDNYFKNSEEMNNSLTNKSYSDNSIDSLKELEFENEANKKLDSKEGSDNFLINNNA